MLSVKCLVQSNKYFSVKNCNLADWSICFKDYDEIAKFFNPINCSFIDEISIKELDCLIQSIKYFSVKEL